MPLQYLSPSKNCPFLIVTSIPDSSEVLGHHIRRVFLSQGQAIAASGKKPLHDLWSLPLLCFRTNYKWLKGTSFSLNWKRTEWLIDSEATEGYLKKWQTLIWEHFLTNTADRLIHIIIKHIGMLISTCDWACNHYIFCVIMQAYPSAIPQINFQWRKHSLMIYVWHKRS